MKKIGDLAKVLYLGLVLVLTVGCLTIEPEVEQEDSVYAGMYTVTGKALNAKTKEMEEVVLPYFEVMKDGKFLGSMDDSGYSGFIGDVDVDGNFTGEMSNMPGSSIVGVIDQEGNLVGDVDLGEYGTVELYGSVQ